MLQRTREAMGGNRVNLVHRLDWGCSGCLLLTYAADTADAEIYIPNTTATLIASMKETASLKTYLALVRGEGLLQGRDFKQEGWFKGILNNATTWFRFVAGQDNNSGRINQPRASLVLARPETGRWHQIRRHLNGLSHPILGDTSHGNSHVNQEWRDLRGMPAQRTCLHLARLQLGPNKVSPNGMDVTCPLEWDMLHMLKEHLPNVLEQVLPILRQEGIKLEPSGPLTILPFKLKLM